MGESERHESTLKRNPVGNDLHLCLPSDPRHIDRVEQFAHTVAAAAGFSTDTVEDIVIAVSEIANNAMLHGNQGDRGKMIRVVARIELDRLVFEVEDEGSGFDADAIPDPTHPSRLNRIGGRGIFIARTLMDAVHFRIGDTGTTVVLSKHRERNAQSKADGEPPRTPRDAQEP